MFDEGRLQDLCREEKKKTKEKKKSTNKKSRQNLFLDEVFTHYVIALSLSFLTFTSDRNRNKRTEPVILQVYLVSVSQ